MTGNPFIIAALLLSLTVGTRVGTYEVLAQIGAGGMGEVYRARDTKLGRDVALKILPDTFARDPERLARFEREARTLAALNHPNIAAIYGVEANALVMEFVPGDDLTQRIARGPVPLAEALPIARQIADALEAAHEAGIIHRDLKPANIKVREDGTVKVLDFGLARALGADTDPGSRDRSTSPTMLSPAVTTMGVILGTAAYMAPEQAKGRPADRRADVWAFGVVLYEMLSGRRLFDAPDVTETLAAVLTSEPKWDALPSATPPIVRRLLARCLAKDRRHRLDSFGAVRLELDDAIAGGSVDAPANTGIAAMTTWGLVAAALAIGAIASHWLWTSRGSTVAPADSSPIVSSIAPPPEAISAFAHGFALSPDATTLVYAARTADGRRRLWKRRLADPHAEAMAGTEGAFYPFWSPDGNDVAFFADGHLKRIPIAGGPTQTIVDAPSPWPRGSWGPSGILYSLTSDTALGGETAGIRLVSASGGQTPKLQVGALFDPVWLPDGRHYLAIDFSEWPAHIVARAIDDAGTAVVVQELGTRAGPSGSNPGFCYSAAGFLIFNSGGVLSLRRFDAATLKVDGPVMAIGDRAGTPRSWFAASVAGTTLVALNSSVASTGGNPGDPISQLQWVDRSGRVIGQLGPAGRYWTLELSHDGLRALANPDQAIWMLDAKTNLRTLLAVGAGAVWMPGDKSVIYRDATGLRIKAAASEGEVRTLLDFTSRTLVPTNVSPDGSTLVATARATVEAPSLDLWQVRIGDGVAKPLVASKSDESEGAVSPDGGWVAYASNANGRVEIYARRMSGEGDAVQISTDGGEHPMWRADGRELFFLSPTDEIVAVDMSAFLRTGQPGARKVLFRVVTNDIIRESYPPYGVTPDGQRFLINTPTAPEPLTLMQRVGVPKGSQ